MMDQVTQGGGFGPDTGKALHHRHIANSIRRMFGHGGMIGLDRILQMMGFAGNQSRQHRKDQQQADKDHRQPPIAE